MAFTNVYYKRAAGTPKACYVCYKPTTTVLATIDTADFLYTCPAHLSDRGFATDLGVDGAGGGRKVGLTDEEIAKVKEEWEEKQRKKAEKEKVEKDKKEKGKDKDKDDDGGKSNKREESKSPKVPGSLSTSTPQTPIHERYALHRDFFAMRQSEHRKRKQAAQAKALAPRLPGAPSGSFAENY